MKPTLSIDDLAVDPPPLGFINGLLALLRHFQIGTRVLTSPPQAGHGDGAARRATSALRIAGRVIVEGS
jgi:hypothetical protein